MPGKSDFFGKTLAYILNECYNKIIEKNHKPQTTNGGSYHEKVQ